MKKIRIDDFPDDTRLLSSIRRSDKLMFNYLLKNIKAINYKVLFRYGRPKFNSI